MVGSLWPLQDDAAALFFEAFYRHLALGRSPGAALAAARRERIEAGAPDSAWAGIVLLGDGSLVPFPGGRHVPWSVLWIWGVALLAVMGTATFLIRTRK